MESGQSRQQVESTHSKIRKKLAQSFSLFRSTDDVVSTHSQSSTTVKMYVDKLIAPEREYDYWNFVPRFHVLPMTIFPVKNRIITDFVMVGENPILSSHKVNLARKWYSTQADDIYFCKINPLNSFMSVLEAFAANCYQFLSNKDIIPSTRALLTEHFEYKGVASKSIREAASIKKDPLKMEELEIKSLKMGTVTVAELDKLDAEITAENLELDKVQDEFTLGRKLTFYTYDNGDKTAYQKTIRVIAKDLKNYRIIKTIAIIITLCHIFMEGDFHRNNIGKKGRWDFDLSLLNLLFYFKDHSWFGHRYRNPLVTKIETVTAEDIRNMPDYKDIALFYGPCVPPPVELLSYLVSKVTSLFSEDPYVIADNAFQREDNAVFRLLKEHPAFIYNKYSTLTRFILTEGNMYKNIAELHIPVNAKPEGERFQNKTLITILTDLLEGRIIKYTEVLVAMPEFADFIKDQGDTVIENILAEMARNNARMERKLMRLEENITALHALQKEKAEAKTQENPAEVIPAEDHEEGFILFNEEKQPEPPKKTKRKPSIDELIAKKQAYEKLIINLDFIRMKYTTLKKLILEEYEITYNPGASILEQVPVMDLTVSRSYTS